MKDFLNSLYDYRDGKIYKKGGDKPCGYAKPNGYVQSYVSKTGKRYVHRLIWIMHNGEIPAGMEIDHLNGVRDDNRIENLRCASVTQNRRNQGTRKRKYPGVNGVSYNKRDNLWHAMISDKAKVISLGHYKCFVSACEARIVAEVNLMYHRNHAMRASAY